MRIDLGGLDIREWLRLPFTDRGRRFATSADIASVRPIEEELALDFDMELLLTNTTMDCTFPGSREIMLTSEYFEYM
jgi:hypothetical protein